MIKQIYLISPDYLKEYVSYLNDNIDNDLLSLSILEAGDIDLQNILGTKLYNSILTKIDNNTLSGDTVYSDLFDNYIEKVIVYYSIKRSLNKLLFKFNNKNIGVKNSDNTEPIDFKTLNFLKSSISDDAEYYSQRLINHLCQYGNSLYVEYSQNTKDDIIPNRKTKYTSGMDLSSISYRKMYENKEFKDPRLPQNNI